MQIKQSIRRNFARRAASYDRQAAVQRFMGEELLALSEAALIRARRILEIGCGTGFLTQKLRQANPGAWLVAVDLDAALINRARARLGFDSRVAYVVADGEAWGQGEFDLIVSNSTFQWFTNPPETLKSYFHRLSPGGVLAFAALGPDTFKELGTSLTEATYRVYSANSRKIAAADFLGQKDWAALLDQAGFSDLQVSRQVLTLNFPTVIEFLQAIQATGATNPHPQISSPRLLKTLIATYQNTFGQNGYIPATYEIIWALAGK
ncbi:MAG: methyltransferase domain-containing protein [Thermodesulfobacteriota bacterium]